MDVLGHRERDFGVDDNEVVANSKEEELGVLKLEGDIITALENHQGVSAEVAAAEAQNKLNSDLSWRTWPMWIQESSSRKWLWTSLW